MPMVGLFRLIVQTLFFVGIAAMIGVSALLMAARAPVPLQAPRIVLIERGMGTFDIISHLSREQAIPNKYALFLVTVFKGYWGQYKAGEYEITPALSTYDIARKMARGDVYRRAITIPEGYTVGDVVRVLKANDVLTGDVTTRPREGRLLPETYAYIRGDTRQAVLNRMVLAMDTELVRVWALRAADTILKSPDELLTLASIVEKETGIAAERPMVASVFLNRLKSGMKLQSDPTVIYALTQGGEPLGRALTTHDLETIKNPYNTYLYSGIPPGPIANPGRAALQAVVQPAATDYFYFVADGTGGHRFARNLLEHNANVAHWRRISAGQKDRK